MFSVIPTLIVT